MNAGGGDSNVVVLEEKLQQVVDLKEQIKALSNDTEEIRVSQEKMNANMENISKQVVTAAETIEKLAAGNRTVDRTVAKRASRVSRNSFYTYLPSSYRAKKPQSQSSVKHHSLKNGASTSTSPTQVDPCTVRRQPSLEEVMKHLTSLAVSISKDDAGNKDEGDNAAAPTSGLSEKKLKRTNLMRRKESQAVLQGVRRLRGAKESALTKLKP